MTLASTTLSLDPVPLPYLDLQGHEIEMPHPLRVFTLNLPPFHISLLFLKCEMTWPYLNFDFSLLIPTTIGKNCCEMEMRHVPPHM